MVTRYTSDASREVRQIERHIHSREIWFGLATSPDAELHRADENEATPFTIDAGNNDFGTAIQVLGSTDTPIQTGMTIFDPGAMFFETAQHNTQEYFIRFICGETAAAGITANIYSTHMIRSKTGVFTDTEIELRQLRCPTGSKIWIQVKAPGQTSSEITVHFAIHEYLV